MQVLSYHQAPYIPIPLNTPEGLHELPSRRTAPDGPTEATLATDTARQEEERTDRTTGPSLAALIPEETTVDDRQRHHEEAAMNSSLAELSPAALAGLEARCREVCVVYRDHWMPAGTRPAVARIGVEADNHGLALYVRLGLTYAGDNPEVADWIRDGVRRFDNLGSLVGWIEQVTPNEPRIPSATLPEVRERPAPLPAARLTSLEEVSVELPFSNAVSELDMQSMLMTSVAGQDAALAILAARIALHTNKQFPRKPYSAMMIGPTAVGKTTTAERVAESLTALSASEWDCIRLDMSEFSEKHSVSRLIGAPPGYIGYGDECLASRLARNSSTVVLFDEIEKAHPAVLFTVMNLLDRGRLNSERYGVVTANKAILLFTSNMGAGDIHGKDHGDRAGRAHLLRYGLAPELVGRFGDIVTFTELSSDALAEIVARSVSTIAADYGVQIEWIDPAYLSNLLQRLDGNRLGVRAIEYLVDADLGEQLAGLESERGRVDFHGTPVVGGLPPADNGEADTDDDPDQAGQS
jgi:hypothetical protein